MRASLLGRSSSLALALAAVMTTPVPSSNEPRYLHATKGPRSRRVFA